MVHILRISLKTKQLEWFDCKKMVRSIILIIVSPQKHTYA